MYSKGHHNIRSRRMSSRKSVEDGERRAFKNVENHFFEGIPLIREIGAVQHFAEYDSPNLLQLSRLLELRQHAIDFVGLLTNVFENEDGIVCVYFIGRSERRNHHRKAASRQTTFGFSGSQHRSVIDRKVDIGIALEHSNQNVAVV